MSVPVPTGTAPTLRRRLITVALLLGSLGFWAMVSAPSASAHTSLVSSNPGADATVATPPTTVELVFAEAVRSPDPKIAVTIEGFDPVEVPATIAGETVSADLTGVDIPGLTSATYPVSWRIGYRLVAADGDPFSGLLDFSVAAAPAPPSTDSTTATPETSTAETSTPPTSEEGAPTSTSTPTSAATSAASTVLSTAGSSTSAAASAAATTTSPAAEPVAALATSSNSAVWWIVGIVVVLLVVGGVVLYLRSRGRSTPPTV